MTRPWLAAQEVSTSARVWASESGANAGEVGPSRGFRASFLLTSLLFVESTERVSVTLVTEWATVTADVLAKAKLLV